VIGELEMDRRDEKTADLLQAAFLTVDGRDVTGRDLLAAGVVSGRWRELESGLSHGLGLVAVERPPAAETRQEVKAFRLQRNLLSADDMRAWLQPRGLAMSAINASAERAVARRLGGTAQDVTADHMAPALASEAIYTGALIELGQWLADRILSARARKLEMQPIPLEEPRIQRLVLEEACTVASATIRELGTERGQRLAWIAALDDAHRGWERSVTDERRMAQLLRERELDWCRLELDELRLASPGAAAEAARQLAEGTRSADVARAAGAPVLSHGPLLADASPEVRRLLAGAVSGDVVGPWHEGDVHVVARVRRRAPPTATDSEVLARARQELLAEGAARLRSGKLTWYERA
jgi:hypothetical protein